MLMQDLSTSSADQLTAGLKTLQQNSTALQNEIGHCDRVLSILHQLASQQVNMFRPICLEEVKKAQNICLESWQ